MRCGQSDHQPRTSSGLCFFFFNDTATTEIYTLSLHDALPIYNGITEQRGGGDDHVEHPSCLTRDRRSEEHTSELQSRRDLVCRLLLEKKIVDFENGKDKHARNKFTQAYELNPKLYLASFFKTMMSFFFNDPASTKIFPLSLHAALPI